MSEPSVPLSRVFTEDHRELDDRFEVFRSTPAGEGSLRAERFGAFASGLRRHIAIEEEQLFPAFERESPGQRWLTERLRDEHRRILDVLERTERQLLGSPPSTVELEEELVNVLWSHNSREEEAVYPWFDLHLAAGLAMQAERALRRPSPSAGE